MQASSDRPCDEDSRELRGLRAVSQFLALVPLWTFPRGVSSGGGVHNGVVGIERVGSFVMALWRL